MEQETRDLLLGAAILVPFLVAVFAAGLVLNRFKNRRFHTAWAPLVPVINGTIVDDGGGAASSWLTGTFQGRKVHAKMAPTMNRSTGSVSGLKYNYFEVAVHDERGGCDWRVEHSSSFLGVGKEGWHVEAPDASIVDRLRQAGVLEMVNAGAGAVPPPALPTVDYRKGTATLIYCEDVGAGWVPSTARFREQLELVLRLAHVNAGVNPAPPR